MVSRVGTVVPPADELEREESVMNKFWSSVAMGIGLVGLSAVAQAGEAGVRPVSEPAGFISGAVVGGFAAGPVGAVIGAGVGTWLGNRVHRAHEAHVAEMQVEKLAGDRDELIETNHRLSAQISTLSQEVERVRIVQSDPATALEGLSGDVLFRTGSHVLEPEMGKQIQALAQALARSRDLKIRIDGYADPRGNEEDNLRLSESRANAVRDVLIAAGISEDLLEVNAWGQAQSEAGPGDLDGYALERRVRLTIEPRQPAAVAQVGSPE